MALYVLDASALLALWFNEPIDPAARTCFSNATISAVNFAEALTVVTRDGHSQDDFIGLKEEAGISVIPFDEATARMAAELVRVTASYGLSLGDRTCLALAIRTGHTALTADRIWRELDVADVRVIR